MKITKISFLFLLSLLLANCSCSPDLIEKLSSNKPEFQSVCQKFIKSKFNSINISKDLDSVKCEGINNWSHCMGNKWEKWDHKFGKQIYLESKEQVLRNENIKAEDFKFFQDFLLKNGLQTITTTYKLENGVDIEFDVHGLRFCSDKNYKFAEDFEYLVVNRIEDNWWEYTRDSN